MNKKIKAIISLLIGISLFFPNFAGNLSFSEDIDVKSNELFIGDYVYFGNFYNYPILWKVISFDNYGNPMLFSEEILDYKIYDAAESGLYKECKYENLEEIIKAIGSSRWSNSNIRDWLNSNEEQVSYLTYPPRGKALYKSKYEYVDEAGFLTHFSEMENEAILKVIHKTVIDNSHLEFKDGGINGNSIEKHYETLDYGDYDEIIYENVEDKVFLLSIKEFVDFVVNKNWNYTVSPSKYILNEKPHKKENAIWIRTAGGNPANSMCLYADESKNIYDMFHDYTASEADFGIRPALYIDKDMIHYNIGNGEKENPYLIITNKKANITEEDKLQGIKRYELYEILVNLYERVENVKLKPIKNNPYIDTANEYVLKGYTLGITGDSTKNIFKANERVTKNEIINLFDKILKLVSDLKIKREDYFRVLTKLDKENVLSLSDNLYKMIKNDIGGDFLIKRAGGKTQKMKMPLVIQNEIIFLPANEIIKILGGRTHGLEINEIEEKRFIAEFNSFYGNRFNIYTSPGWNKIIVQINNKEIPWLDISNPPKVIDGVYMLPIEVIEKGLNVKVRVDFENKVIEIIRNL